MAETGKLQLFALIENTVTRLEENQPFYTAASQEIKHHLLAALCEYHDGLIDIHTRVKSPVSLKEKIIRNKLYKPYETPEQILDNLSDVIGVMVACRFNKNETELLSLLKKQFHQKHAGRGYFNPMVPGMFLDLDVQQPQKQKNGHEIFRIDGYYRMNGKKVNFELQIKSLVNTFWSEIEHKVVYKNNVYIPNSGYVMEMLTAIKGNLAGIDKMLQLVNDQIQDSVTYKTGAPIDINFAIAKLMSDTFVAKMSESVGFTVDFKRICDLISGYLLNKYKDFPVRVAQSAFLDLMHRFNEIHTRKIDLEQQLHLEEPYVGEDRFCQIFGDRLLSLMNSDFEWHIFFLMLFQIESDSNNLESFSAFMNSIRSSYSDKGLYKELYASFDSPTADRIYEKLTEFLAYTLSATASINIIASKSEETHALVKEITSHVVRSYCSYDDFIRNRKAVQMMILEKWGT